VTVIRPLKPVEELDKALGDTDASDELAEDGKAGRGQARFLLQLAREAELFKTPGREPYARLSVNGHKEVWPVDSEGFGDWLQAAYWQAKADAPRDGPLRDALRTLKAQARNSNVERFVCLRVGEADGALYHDLGDESWRAGRITPQGWEVVAEPAVFFRRGSSALPLPVPVRGGSLDELRPFIHPASDEDWRLLIAWVVHSLMPYGPYPPLVLGGEQDSGKTATARALKDLVDPDDAPLTSSPRDEEDLVVVAADNWLPIYDNLSRLDGWFSDALCRLAEGTSLKRRARYTNSTVVVVKAKRPVILNGIGDLASRGDLLSRALILTLPPLLDGRRRSEADLRQAFAEARPRILGALYDAVTGVLRVLPQVSLASPPRMGDFARVGVALEQVQGWPEGSFLAAYGENRASSHDIALESSPIVEPLLELVSMSPWTGSATDLLGALNQRVSDELTKMPRWPKTARVLSQQLTRLAPHLRAQGFLIDRDRAGKARGRFLEISFAGILRPLRPPEFALNTDAPPAGVRPPVRPPGGTPEFALNTDAPSGGVRPPEASDSTRRTQADASGRTPPGTVRPPHPVFETGGKTGAADEADDPILLTLIEREGEEAEPAPLERCSQCGSLDWSRSGSEPAGSSWNCTSCGQQPGPLGTSS
jgi:hypothetical protein